MKFSVIESVSSDEVYSYGPFPSATEAQNFAQQKRLKDPAAKVRVTDENGRPV